jgi:hypothetical protein
VGRLGSVTAKTASPMPVTDRTMISTASARAGEGRRARVDVMRACADMFPGTRGTDDPGGPPYSLGPADVWMEIPP